MGPDSACKRFPFAACFRLWALQGHTFQELRPEVVMVEEAAEVLEAGDSDSVAASSFHARRMYR